MSNGDGGSDPLPPSAALPLCEGENQKLSPLQRGAAKRQGAAPSVPI